jgi:alanine racemase
MSSTPPRIPLRAEARIDLAAIRDNVATLRARTAAGRLMAVVKADGYGHGMIPAARAAQAGGADWLGVAYLPEAIALRQAGITGRILCWIWTPGEDWDAALHADVDVSASAIWAIEEIAEAVRRVDIPARVHLKADTGLGRSGAQPHDWPALVEAALKAQADGTLTVVGLWSHFACADWPDHPSVDAQLAAFRQAVAHAEAAGITPEVRHLANSPATLLRPDSHFDMVRAGLSVYGLSPAPDQGSPADFGLRPAMTLMARLALVKRVPSGHGVSYGHHYQTSRETTLALVPLGYADGIPRGASDRCPVLVAGARRTIAGRVAMDQFVVDLGDAAVAPGDEVVLFGPGDHGEPTAEEWAQALDTISYEIVTRIGPRVPRVYMGDPGTAVR